MTAAQKTAKAKFKQAIAYRQKTGVSLKEAFAHIYGKKKVGAVKKKAAPKKKAGNMKIAKYKVGQKVYSYQNKDYSAPINKLVYSPWNNSGKYDKRDTYKYVLSLKDGNSNFIDEKSISKKSIGAVKKKAAKKVVRKVVKKKAAPKKKAAKKQYGLNLKLDKLYEAGKPGKRTSASGNTYYEYRKNRTDKNKFSGIGSVLTKNQEIKRLSQLAKTPLEKRIVSILKYKLQDYDNLKSLMEEVLQYGLQSGIISDLIYYNDTLAFYKRYKKEIDILLKDIMNESGANSPADIFGKKWDNEDWSVQDTNNKNLLAWFGFEEKARELADKLGYEI